MPVQQKIADGSPADGRNDGNDDHAEKIHTLATRRKGATDRKDRHTYQIEHVKQHENLLPTQRYLSSRAAFSSSSRNWGCATSISARAR